MVGKKSWRRYIFSGKWQPGMGNKFAGYGTGKMFKVPASSIKKPTGWGWDGAWKGLFGQRKYIPSGP